MTTPLTQIVDEHDIVIGHKRREDVHPKTDIYRVSALWITNSHGDVLLAQRSFTKKNSPGRWGPAVAGTVEDDESYIENIIKESEEELGIQKVTFSIMQKERIRSPRNYFCQWYGVTIDEPASAFRIQSEEVEQIKWIDYDDLRQDVELHPENYVQGLKRFLQLE